MRKKLKTTLTVILSAGSFCFASASSPANAAGEQPFFACKSVSGKLVRFAREGRVLRYSYGKPGQAADLTFSVPLASASFSGSGPSGAGTWWVTREISVLFNGTQYTGHWAYHRGEGTEEAGVTVSRAGRTLAETACKSDIQVDIPEVDE